MEIRKTVHKKRMLQIESEKESSSQDRNKVQDEIYDTDSLLEEQHKRINEMLSKYINLGAIGIEQENYRA